MTVASNNVEDLIEHIVSVLNESGIDHIADELQDLHPADIARLLESIPPESRELVWPHIETCDAVRPWSSFLKVCVKAAIWTALRRMLPSSGSSTRSCGTPSSCALLTFIWNPIRVKIIPGCESGWTVCVHFIRQFLSALKRQWYPA